ncbi:beta-glucosidase [Caulobacter sp. 602-1]|nr:beta-glucosidase [Caulobacter sp. 602-1]
MGPDTSAGHDARVAALLAKMTLDDKIALIRGAQEPAATDQAVAGYLAGVPRLGVPAMRFADGPPGILTREPSPAPTATMGLAATFSRLDAQKNGAIIGLEARRLGVDVALEPFINILRDISTSRGWNTFGEDPVLSGVMGAEQVEGIQGQGVMAQAKHFVGYDNVGFKAVIDPQTLHEVYLAPFADAVDAGVSSVMCAYNQVNGAFACGNDKLLNTILRGDLGFKGFVTSDWGGAHKPTDLKAGLDMEMPGLMAKGSPWLTITRSYFDNDPAPIAPLKMSKDVLAKVFTRTMPEEDAAPRPPSADVFAGQFPDDPHPTNIAAGLADGAIDMAAIDRAAARVLRQMARFGYLDGGTHQPTGQAPDPRIAAVIRQTSTDAAVLLKNDDAALPLKAADYADLALIGPGAGQVVALGINAEHALGVVGDQKGVYEVLAARLAKTPGAKVSLALANDMTGVPAPAALLSYDGAPGVARFVDGRQVGRDAAIDFTGARRLPAGTTGVWKTKINIPADGRYGLYLQVLGANAELSVDGKLVGRTSSMIGARHGDTVQAGQDNLLPTTDGLNNVRRDVELTAGEHALEITTSDDTSRAPVQLRLNWVTPQAREATYRQAVETAANAKKVVVFAWARRLPVFGLPGDQDRLISDIAARNPNTVVVLNTSLPVAMPWLTKVKAVVNMWWPGDQGAQATADILQGRASPAGRLPFTWAKRLEDYPTHDARHPERGLDASGEVVYSEGLHVGYRWFDKNKIEPLYPFGYGLSYSRFAYSDLNVAKARDGGLDVRFKVKNVGKVTSDEVAQVYLGAPKAPPAGVDFATRALAGFDRITLHPNETRTLSIHLTPRRLQYWSETDRSWRNATGEREVFVGPSSRDLPLRRTVR